MLPVSETMSLNSSVDGKLVQLTPVGATIAIKVKQEITLAAKGKLIITGCITKLISLIKTMSLKGRTKHVPEGCSAAKLKGLFDNTKFIRGKPKGNTYAEPLPWIRYFLVGSEHRLEPDIYVWIINSESSSIIYRLDSASGNFERCADATKSFRIGVVDYLPDVVNQRLFTLGPQTFGVILLGLEDALATHRMCVEEPHSLELAFFSPSLGVRHHPSDGSSESEAGPSNTFQSGSSNGLSPPTAVYYSQLQATPAVNSLVFYSPNTVKLPVPVGIQTTAELKTNVDAFKAAYNNLHGTSPQVICGQCEKLQKDIRPTSLIRHLASHLSIKDHKCSGCDEGFITKDQLAKHQKKRDTCRR